MKKKLLEAPLNGKDLCPDDIINGITNGRFMMHDGKAVGFIYEIPAIFYWNKNCMKIYFKFCIDMREALEKVRREISDMMTTDKRKYVHVIVFQKTIALKMYWQDL